MQTQQYVPDRRNAGAYVAVGLWLRLAFIGASAVIASLVAFVGSNARSVDPLLFAACGAWLAIVSWRKGWIALERAASDGSGAPSAPDPKRAVGARRRLRRSAAKLATHEA